MTAPVMTTPSEPGMLREMLRPEPLPDGTQPEQRVVYSPVSWARYLAFDETLGHDRPGPRLYYLDGELEIMTTSKEHERLKEWFGGFMDIYFEAIQLEVMHHGQATMRLALKEAGAEPDKSWCIREEKEFPDIVLEIALTSGGVNKLETYRRFQVPEVWFWRQNKLEVFVLAASGQYEHSPASRLLPNLDIGLLERCVAIPSWQQARRAFRAGFART